jgi:hypothetical protein
VANILEFPEYAPDISPFGEEESQLIQNVFPRKDGYGAVPSPSVYSAALAGPCRGYFAARKSDGSIVIFAGTATKLFQMSNTTFTWTDVSKGAGSYSSVPAADQWQFVQFNNFVIACQINTVPQVIDITTSNPFADLGGSPPQARYCAVVNRFLVLSGLGSSTPYRVQWSGLNALTTWDGTLSSGSQDLPDGGLVRGVGGGEYGLITQDTALRLLIFAPGTTYTFQIERLAYDKGIFTPLSLVRAGDNLFFCGNDGFQKVAFGQTPQFIGKERVDRTFFADVDASSPAFMIGAYDPGSTRVFWAYKSLAGATGQFDKVLCYDFALDKWTPILGWGGQYIASLARPGLTLEGMDALASGIISITGAVGSGAGGTAGSIKLTLGSEVANWNYGLADTQHTKGQPGTTTLSDGSQNTIEVYGVGGTTEANNNWNYTVVDGTHIALTGSTFVNTYTTGGAIGGAVDSFAFSFDDLATNPLAKLSIFDTSNRLNFLSGANLEALLDSSEHSLDGSRRSRVQGFRPDTDATTALGSIGARENIQTVPAYTTEQAVNSKGLCPMNVSTRMARARIRIPAGSVWTFATGVEPVFKPEGIR